jgi:hypothetical protein
MRVGTTPGKLLLAFGFLWTGGAALFGAITGECLWQDLPHRFYGLGSVGLFLPVFGAFTGLAESGAAAALTRRAGLLYLLIASIAGGVVGGLGSLASAELVCRWLGQWFEKSPEMPHGHIVLTATLLAAAMGAGMSLVLSLPCFLLKRRPSSGR